MRNFASRSSDSLTVLLLYYNSEPDIVGGLPCQIGVADVSCGVLRTAVPCAAANHFAIALGGFALVGVGGVCRAGEFGHVAVHVVQSPSVGGVLRHVGYGHRAVVDRILARHEGVITIHPTVFGHGLRVDSRHSHLAQRTVGQVLGAGEIAVQIAEPEIGVAARAACPLPLRLGGQRGLHSAAFAYRAAELRRLIPAYAGHGLVGTVGGVPGTV